MIELRAASVNALDRMVVGLPLAAAGRLAGLARYFEVL